MQWISLSAAQLSIELVATLAFALSGILAAARARLDAVGVCIVAGVAAFGGGTIRDLLLDRRPFFWVEHDYLVWAVLALCILAMAFMRARHFHPTARAIAWPDAVGLAMFSATGTQMALAAEMPALLAVLMGIITAVFGGVLRDVVCNEVPEAFRDHRPYAVCSFVGGWVMVALDHAGAPASLTLAAAAAVTLALRALAIRFDWRVPEWEPDK